MEILQKEVSCIYMVLALNKGQALNMLRNDPSSKGKSRGRHVGRSSQEPNRKISRGRQPGKGKAQTGTFLECPREGLTTMFSSFEEQCLSKSPREQCSDQL